MSDPRFPIGKFSPELFAERTVNIGIIAELPKRLSAAVAGLDDAQLESPYRENGWTLRQTVHHIADSHLNAYCRFKLALTEELPTIRPYREELWAELIDSKLDLGPSLQIIDGIHRRWSALLQNMTDADMARELIHPESGTRTLENMLGLYAWHSQHHLAHITTTCDKNGWQING